MRDESFEQPGDGDAAVRGLATVDKVAWTTSDDELADRIVRAGEPALARLRREPADGWRTWPAWTARWSRITVPVAMAAGLAAAVVLARVEPASTDQEVTIATTETVGQLLLSGSAGASLSARLVAPDVGSYIVTGAAP